MLVDTRWIAPTPTPMPPSALSRIARSLVWPALAIPILGWIFAQGFEDRIPLAEDGVAAYVHTLTVSSFAVILFLSMTLNGLIVSVRWRNRPDSLVRSSRFPLWSLILDGSGAIWTIDIALSNGLGDSIELVSAIVIATASVFVFVFAVWRDPAAAQRGQARRALKTAASEPDVRARRRRVTLNVGLSLGLLVAASGLTAAIVAEITPTEHTGCQLDGKLRVDGAEYTQVTTTNCGDFDLPGGAQAYRNLNVDYGDYNIKSRGYAFDLPPRAIITSLTKLKD